MVTTCTCLPAMAYPAAAIAPARVLPSPVAISITSPASMRSAPSNCTSNGRSPVALSPASRAIARNCEMSSDSARSSRLSNPAAFRSFSSSRSAASLSYSAEAVTSARERVWFFSVLAPSSRQKRLLRRPGSAWAVFGTDQRYATPPPARACVFARDTPGFGVQLRTFARSGRDGQSAEVGSAWDKRRSGR